ncbi:MAG: phosphoenolpyruvate--protein phosphotransferase [Chloroflexota bacterium]
MVGLVFVSHSRALAEALATLVRQVAPGDVPIAVAAGVGEARQEFGTDAVEISEAIQSVYSDDGVCVLMDLGSAVLSAELARDLLFDVPVEKLRFCSAPIVEGAIAAAVQAGLGSDLDTVCREARGALLPKQEHLGEHPDQPAAPPSAAQANLAARSAAGQPQHAIEVTLTNLHGLHARPAARFVKAASGFDADVQVVNLTTGKGPVSARSLNAVATLGAIEYHTVRISAAGSQAEQALAALRALVEDNFGEAPAAAPAGGSASAADGTGAGTPGASETAAGPAGALPEGAQQATPVAEGIAFGPFYRYQPPLPPIPDGPAQDVDAEWRRLQAAIHGVEQALGQRRRQLLSVSGEAEAAIFDAHRLILEDPDLLAQVRRRITESRQNAAQAWNAALDETAAAYRALNDAYLQQRAADVIDVRDQVLFALAGGDVSGRIELEHPVVLFANDMTPSQTSQLDMSRVLGLMTVGGGPTSHSAILARALGIPAISGVSAALERLEPGTPVALDGFRGLLWTNPPAELQAQLSEQRQAWLDTRQRLLQTSQGQAVTRDGHRVEVFANIGSVADSQAAVKNGAEGVGLLRTEFLFLTRTTPPSEAEQLDALRQVGAAMGGRPIVARTLDVGGDKEVPYVQLPEEANPFLGVRAIRLCLHDLDLFMPQLRAILQAAADYPYRIMFPMVANVDEVRQARALLARAHEELQAAGLPHAWPVETGIMVEIPSAALISPVLAKEVDFFSIGTNDLTQYTLAAERGNPMLAGLADALHPAVLRMIGEVVQAAHANGRWVGVCGELAGDPQATAVLTGLGVDELSMTAGGVPRVKAILRALALTDAQSLAQRILAVESAPQARRLAQEFLNGLQLG